MNSFSFLKKRSFWRVAWAVALLLWVIFIFSNSLTPGESSKRQSDGAVDVIDTVLNKISPGFSISAHFVRKLAHFVEFFILGTLLYSFQLLWNTDKTLHLFRTLFSGIITALLDETLQLASPGRGSRVSDVWLDFSAVVLSIIVYSLIYHLIKHKKAKKSV